MTSGLIDVAATARLPVGMGAVLAALPHPAFAMDARCREFVVNGAWSRCVTNAALQSAGEWTDALHPDDRFTAQHIIKTRSPSRMPFTFELRLGGASDQTFLWHMLSVQPLRDDVGILTGWFAIATDIHDSLRSADALRQSGLRALGGSVLDAVSAGKPLTAVLEMVARSVDRMNPATFASILLVDNGRLRHGAAPGLPAPYNEAIDGTEVGERAGSCGAAAVRRAQVITTNIGTDPLWDGLAQIASSHGLAACWSTPVLDAAGNVLATFGVFCATSRGPEPHEKELIREVGRYIRIAIEGTRQAEHLRRSEARYRSIYDIVPVLIWEEDWSEVIPMVEELERRGVTDLAAHFDAAPGELTAILKAVRVLSVNQTGARMFGAETGEELIAAFDELVANSGARRIFTRSLTAWAAGERELETESVNFDLQGRPLHLLVKVALPVRGSGETRLVLSEMDVTEMRLADERFRIIAQATSDVVLDRDLILDQIWCSDGMKTRFGHDRAALASGAGCYAELIHPEDRARVMTSLSTAVARGDESWSATYRLRCADGRFADVRERSIILRTDDGRPLRMIGSLVDITEQLQIEEQLRQSQRLDAIGQLTGGVAHDFNNLLTVILGNTEFLSESLEDERLRALADMCTSAALRGAELTNRLLAFARKQSLDPRRVDVNALARGLEGLLVRALGENVEIRVVSTKPVWPALADAAQLESAILNLCLNARDAMPRGGSLTIETADVEIGDSGADAMRELSPGAYVMIAVSDTGIGMDAATAARAVEPFFTTKEVGKGSGLGLSMVYGFVKQSHGHLTIRSHPGAGTTVQLYLPRSQETVAVDLPVHEADAPGGDEAILLVEDDDLVRAHVEAQLTALGYRISSAATASEALAILERSPDLDLLFTDIVMPGGMSGIELAETVAITHPDLPVLFTSGYSEEQTGRDRPFRPGQQVLRKPYRRQELATQVRSLLDRSSAKGL